MVSERVQRTIDQLLDHAADAAASGDWAEVRALCGRVLDLDPGNNDARDFSAAAERALARGGPADATGSAGILPASSSPLPTAFANDRYQVIRFLGEGGKKKVYLAHDTLLDRDVAFALIKTEGLDAAGRSRIAREAQAMGRLGAHPHIVTVFDLGEEPYEAMGSRQSPGGAGGSLSLAAEGQGGGTDVAARFIAPETGTARGQPYMVTELMAGGDVEGLIDKAPEGRLPLEQALTIAEQVCQGLEFAHGKGIVHRDLKPGNVWLTADLTPGPFPTGEGETVVPSPRGGGLGRGRGAGGEVTAKIGDFGLAVAVDRSRLTQAGMMVGTVSYMPPEQAMGGEVTPRSDLYSLGAMLYEMVTGRPPFVGDEHVAIIGQHLNTPPVAPTWHRPDCPPGLETLILRLLEKDPSRRPQSATEVRAALESVAARDLTPRPPYLGGKGADDGSPPHIGEGLGERSDNPLYRRVFVGREHELRTLQTSFDAALSGQGGLLMVVGEPGIGKTAVCEQLATYVTLRGGTTLTGHCYEEGSLSLPYLAFVEALRSYVQSRPPEALRAELGTAASDVARIVSEVRERLAVEPRPPGDPEEDRWRLLQAVTGFLRSAATVQPLLLVLEDLHWADQGTLDLLLHLARSLSGTRLLVVGSYRDVEVDRGHPLSATLAELRRGASFARVLLRGLGTPEVQRMFAAITGAEAPGSLAETVHRQTEGNPLFVQEVVRYLVEEGHLGHGSVLPSPGATRSDSGEARYRGAGGEVTAAGIAAMSIPEGLRDVIGRRLSRLSPDCNRVLAVAAVIGRDFGLETLRSVSELSEEQVVSSLEEALHIGVLEESSSGRPGFDIRYRFAHAFFRQTLYEELIAPRRLRLHQQVAAALERQYANRLEEHAAELAEHFAQSTDRDDLAKAVRYGELAANRALTVYAYGEAARHLEQALAVQEVLDPDDTSKRCDLLLALGEALAPAGDPLRAAEQIASQALALAEVLGVIGRASRACRLALEAMRYYGAATMRDTLAYRRWVELAGRYAAPGTAERAFVDQTLGRLEYDAGRAPRGRELMRSALALARDLCDEDLCLETARILLNAQTPESAQEERLLAEELTNLPREGASASTVGNVLWYAGSAFLNQGDRKRAEELWQDAAEIGARSRDPASGLLVREIWLATLDGELDKAVSLRADALSRADELGRAVTGQLFGNTAASKALFYLGRADEAMANLASAGQMVSAAESPNASARRAVYLAHLGRRDEAAELMAGLLSERRLGPEAAGAGTLSLVSLLEAAVLIEDLSLAELLSARLGPLAAMGSSGGSIAPPTCIGRHLGAAAALLGDPEAARRNYGAALDLAGRIRHRPEAALANLGIAELLLANYPDERTEAIEHLDFAIGEFRDMKMQPSLERALRHKEVLKA